VTVEGSSDEQSRRDPVLGVAQDRDGVVASAEGPDDRREATATDLSGSLIREVDTKPPWVIASELARRAEMIRDDRDPQFRQAKTMVQNLPPMILRVVLDTIGLVTETLQLPVPFMGLEARPYGSFLVSNVGTFGLDSPSPRCRRSCTSRSSSWSARSRTRRWPGPGSRWCGPCCRSASASTTASSTATRPRPWRGSSGSTWPIRPSPTRYRSGAPVSPSGTAGGRRAPRRG
jgi:hypothetical protein